MHAALRTFLKSTTARGFAAAIAVAMAVFLFVGAEAVASTPLFPEPFDKVAHFLYYGVMAVLLSHALNARHAVIAVIAVVLVGMCDEWHQASVAGRESSFGDVAADMLGAAALVYLHRMWWMKYL